MLQQLEIRNAELSDVDVIYKWSHDDLVRKQSYNSGNISYDTHCEWFKNKLADKNALIFIIETQGVPTGMVRFDIVNEMATIGISVDKNYRREGLAAAAINMAVNEYFSANNFPIQASIKEGNIASVKSFEKAGFTYLRKEEINGAESVVYQLEKTNNE